jgi:hypothetical protein
MTAMLPPSRSFFWPKRLRVVATGMLHVSGEARGIRDRPTEPRYCPRFLMIDTRQLRSLVAVGLRATGLIRANREHRLASTGCKKQLYLWRVDQYCDFRESGSILYGYSIAPPQWLAASAMQGFSVRVGWFRSAEIV